MSHLVRYKKHESPSIFSAIKRQLPFQPTQETRNRKKLRENALADWELRIQHFRVFYDVDLDDKIVRIVAVGHKQHNKLYIADQEFSL